MVSINGLMTSRIGFRSAQYTYQSVQSLASVPADTGFRKTVPGAVKADSESRAKPNAKIDAQFKPHHRLTQDTVTLSAAARAAFTTDTNLSLDPELLDDLRAMAQDEENSVSSPLNFAQFKERQLDKLRLEARQLEQRKQEETQSLFQLEIIDKQLIGLKMQIAMLNADELNEPDAILNELVALEG